MGNESNDCTIMASQSLFDDEAKDDKMDEDDDLVSILSK